MIGVGLDRLLAEPRALAGRRFGLLSHPAALSADLVPAHLALARAPHGELVVLFGPEHGFYGVEQDMVASADATDPWTGVPIRSLYGSDPASLAPSPDAFAGIDLLIVDLQDVGSRYYTFAASAAWAVRAAVEQGCEAWILDRPNPLGGEVVEGPGRELAFGSFVGAFDLPVRHGLTLAELVLWAARGEPWSAAVRVWELTGWERAMGWSETERPWLPPSPNMPRPETARLYPGTCLIEATTLSEGRGTTRPLERVGAPGIDPVALAAELGDLALPGVRFVPGYFRPQFQKHAGRVCGGVDLIAADAAAPLRPVALGVELLAAVRRVATDSFGWRAEAYEFVTDRPAIDLLSGGEELRRLIDGGEHPTDWIASWRGGEEEFRRRRREILLYPEETQ